MSDRNRLAHVLGTRLPSSHRLPSTLYSSSTHHSKARILKFSSQLNGYHRLRVFFVPFWHYTAPIATSNTDFFHLLIRFRPCLLFLPYPHKCHGKSTVSPSERSLYTSFCTTDICTSHSTSFCVPSHGICNTQHNLSRRECEAGLASSCPCVCVKSVCSRKQPTRSCSRRDGG